ncbi:GNAT family N-acetyltransferase [Burkholderia sp. L27(2015)]|uniref:GNAT family N-acetyltransferase n=1 Tax=Burkholderia sp. L27(2015) TaxID=1641858 RepID=UPI0020B13C9E|nr:GNAT family N-acetyltransferase [Burkholderia sp. L27(2015)]
MVYAHHDLLAIWPLAIHRKGMLRIASVMTSGNIEEYGGPLIKGRATAPVVAECVRAAMQVPADVLEISFVQDGSLLQEALESSPQPWLLRLSPIRLNVLPGYSIGLREFDKWEDFTDTLSPSLRRNLRRYRKGLSSIGSTEFGWCTTFDDAVAVLTWLFANKRRWAETRGLNTQYLMDNEVRDFFIELAQQTDLSTVPLVTFIKVDGVPVAASINLVGPRTLEYWIFTYDEAYSRYSVGNLLTEFVARWTHANRRDFDMRVLYNEYKTYWANRETSHQTRCVLLSARGRVMEIRLLFYLISRVQRRLGKTVASALEKQARLARRLLRSRSSEARDA